MALTFDDGPAPHGTEAIVDLLGDAGITATFFVLGENCAQYPTLLRHIVKAGMSIGVHGWSHANLVGRDAAFVTDELQRSLDVLGSAGAPTRLFRPPGGRCDRQVVTIARSLGLHTIIWDVDPRDWEQLDAAVIVENVLADARDRSIILLHDGGGHDRSQTVRALPALIDGLRARGLAFADLAQQHW